MSDTNEREPSQTAGETRESEQSEAERLLTRRRLLVKTALVSAPVLMSLKGRAAWGATPSEQLSGTHASHQPQP